MIVTIARVIALLLSGTTFVFLFLHGSFRADNLFLWPDLALCAALLVAAVLPTRSAGPALLLAFGISTGVLMASVGSYAVRGEIGVASLIGLIIGAAFAALLLHHLIRPAAAPARDRALAATT